MNALSITIHNHQKVEIYKCPSMDEWKNELLCKGPWMDLKIVILSEVSQTAKDKHDIAIHGILKKWYKETYLQNRNRITDIENKRGY